LPKIATGELRLQAFGVTEPNSGSDTTKLQTTAIKKGDRYIVNGQKMFISRVLQSDLMLLLARTTPVDRSRRRRTGSASSSSTSAGSRASRCGRSA
jgi:acyl-CoA dehydrogenase